jgi:predicted signal transduction protein with EAL and GGDEF domain
MGGDEFAVIQVAIMQPSDATSLARRIIEVVSAPYEIDGHQAAVGTSIGIAIGPADGVTPEQLIRNADMALYRAKSDGRGAYRFFELEMDAQMQARRVMEYALRRALAAHEFELHYQPMVSLENNSISGFEALVRWRHPQQGILSPATFMPLAEESGLTPALAEWSIREACRAAAQWRPELKIAVNLSPAQFRNAGLVPAVVSALAASGLAPQRLELEITEFALIGNNEAALETLHKLRALGVRVAMDDFGTGYSSLSSLQSFPFDKIKIDGSFVRDCGPPAASLSVVRAMVSLASDLGMATTAEGVETKEQLDAMRSEGCTEMQGFFFSQPLPLIEIEKLYGIRPAQNADAAEHAA